VVVDAGCELEFYTADVTRTFPASGRFTPAQRRLYEVVLRAQEQAIQMTRPGVTIDEVHGRCVELLTEGMVELGLLQGPPAERISDSAYKKFYMHRTSHWLGMDVHDVGAYTDRDGAARPLEAGMVITIEPGLYVAADAEGVPEELRGCGVRIEDDILVTAGGCEVLTAAVPRQVDEVERACQAGVAR
jgi:Xaa-Pro aminopeptidase